MTDNSQRIPAAYAITFSTPTGQAVLDHLHQMFYDVDSFNADPYVHARNAGMRHVVRHIMQVISRHESNQKQAQQGEQEE